MTLPEPGIYNNVPMSEYHKWPAISNSGLGHLSRSPAHYKAYLDEPPADTKAFQFGRAVHSAILEPDVFKDQYVCAPPLDRRTKAGKEAWAVLVEERGAENILAESDYLTCLKMRASVWKRKAATGLLGGDGNCEVSAIFVDDTTGVTCKVRADRISPKLAGGTIVDLKTTTDASLLNFEKSIFNFGYHRQGAFYLAGFYAAGIDVQHFSIIAVEKTPPYEVGVYRLTEGAIEAGMEQVNRLMSIYAECKEKDEWPGYPDKVKDIALPAWAWNRIEDEKAVNL